jgi:Peptidase family M23/Protein of unknown function (DUF3887)
MLFTLMLMKHALLLLVLLLVPAGSAFAQQNGPAELGQRYTGWFYTGDLDQLWQRFTPAMQKNLDREKLTAFREQLQAQIGSEASVLRERVTRSGTGQVYLRTAKFEKAESPIIVQWTMDQQGRISGFFVRPTPTEALSQLLDYQTKTPLRLPFTGEWFVLSGGRTAADNDHAAEPAERFAYDLVVMRGGRTYQGDGSANEQYFCWDQPVLAPGKGVVVVAIDGIEDNEPGTTNPDLAPGNHVVIDHGNGEYSFLEHLRKGSIAVKQGNRVQAGTRLGACGNSGSSNEPHLHYHLQNTEGYGVGSGYPAQFMSYVADGKAVARGEPKRGQTLRSK